MDACFHFKHTQTKLVKVILKLCFSKQPFLTLFPEIHQLLSANIWEYDEGILLWKCTIFIFIFAICLLATRGPSPLHTGPLTLPHPAKSDFLPLPLQENTSDCGRGHSFRPSLVTLLLVQLLLLYPAVGPNIYSLLH